MYLDDEDYKSIEQGAPSAVEPLATIITVLVIGFGLLYLFNKIF